MPAAVFWSANPLAPPTTCSGPPLAARQSGCDGLLPPSLTIAPLLAEARRQLHDEANYAREGRALERFAALLDGADDYVTPRLQADLTTPDVLAMSFVEGVAVESLVTAPQAERDRVATLLLALTLRELFAFGVMQTDPNFANYRYDPATGKLVLLDFGATRDLSPAMTAQYRALIRAALDGDMAQARRLAIEIGFFDAAADPRHIDAAMALAEAALAPLRAEGVYDFGDPALLTQLRDGGLALAAERDFWHLPPVDALFVQRKVAGMVLLARRLKARVDVRALLTPYL